MTPFYIKLATLAVVATTASIQAAVVTVDGVTITKLSDAVTQAQDADDGPHIINITTNAIVNDGPVYIKEPMTINGDGNSDNVRCDILVDIPAIRLASASALASGVPEKAYIVVESTGTVELKDLNIHPNEDGVDAAGTNDDKVDGIRAIRPAVEDGTYLFTRLGISGSDASNNYIPLDTGDDIYSGAAKKWSGGSTGNAVIQLSAQGLGTYSATLDHCHVGLGKSAAVNSPASGTGIRQILGGLYGHCGMDGVRVSGTAFKILGTPTDRVRIVRATSIGGGNAHCLEVDGGGRITNMEYVDLASINNGNCIKLNSGAALGRLIGAKYIRVMGKLDSSVNSTVYANLNTDLTISDSTMIGGGLNSNPFQTQTNYAGDIKITDSIFTSESYGRLIVDNAAGATFALTNCAFPTDDVAGESLTTTGTVLGGGAQTVPVTAETSVTVSPNYLLTLEDYDWSDAQGTGNPLNGPGNANVYRPTNVAYLTASSTGGPLVGGAGLPVARIGRETWMLME